MLESQEVTLDGQTYLWHYDPHVPEKRCWSWLNPDDFKAVPETLVQRLNQVFIDEVAPALLSVLDETDSLRLRRILRHIGGAKRQRQEAVNKSQSPLAEFGYSVEENGPDDAERKDLLSRFFQEWRKLVPGGSLVTTEDGNLEWVESDEPVALWGEPGPSSRLCEA